MSLLKRELEIGDLLIASDNLRNKYVEVNKLILNIPHQSDNQVETPYVGVRILKSNDEKSIHETYLRSIIVTPNILNQIGFKTTTKDGLPIQYLGEIILVHVAVEVDQNNIFRSPWSLVANWDKFLNCKNLFSNGMEQGSKSFREAFPPMNELHILLRYLESKGHKIGSPEDMLDPL